VFVIFIFLSVVNSTDCSDATSCLECTNSSSWLSNCRWCPLDNICHAFGSVLDPCTEDQTIVDPGKCPIIPHTTNYTQLIGYEALLFSYSAYMTENGSTTINASYLPPSFTVNRTIVLDISLSLSSSCLGYFGVDHDNHQIIIAFRGTIFGQLSNLIIEQLVEEIVAGVVDLLIGGVHVWPDQPDVKVASYYGQATQLLLEMTNSVLGLVGIYPDYEILVTGHSLGGALASIMATNLQRNLPFKKDLYLITFGQPRTGNLAYSEYVDKLLFGRSYRVVANADLVPHVPPLHTGAIHHGVEIWYSSTGFSPDRVPCKYQECTANDEDYSCSDGLLLPTSIYDHIHTYWCAVPMGYCQSTTSNMCPLLN